MQRPGWSIRLASVTQFSWRNGALRMNTAFEAFEGEKSIFQKAWDYDFPW
jgi:hypothetical protein